MRGVKTGAKKYYQRTCIWTSLLGNRKCKLLYSENVLMMSINASARLHNFIFQQQNPLKVTKKLTFKLIKYFLDI